jgi:hypothetical protein
MYIATLKRFCQSELALKTWRLGFFSLNQAGGHSFQRILLKVCMNNPQGKSEVGLGLDFEKKNF